MSDQGKLIVDTVHQLKSVYKQISLLIQAGDTLMEQHGWKPDSSTVSYGSKAYYSPEEWLASTLVRAYKHAERIGERKLLAVVLDVDSDKSFNKFEVPLVTGTSIKMNDANTSFSSWYVSDTYLWFLKDPNSVSNGAFRVINHKDLYPDEKRVFGSIGVVACPLTEVGSSEQLDKKIVKPLLDA